MRLLCLLALASPPGDAAARVVLVGVDGGSWNVIDPLLEKGELPSLARIRDRGVTAGLAAVEPVNSPTVWTSIATGRSPEAHGVTYFFTTRLSIRVPTVWDRLSAGGRRVGLYEYLVTWPPASYPGGFVIPGWIRRDDAIRPPDAFERAGVSPFIYSVVGVGGPDEFVSLTRRELAEKPSRWNRLADAFDLDVGAVSFYALDAVSHRFWHASFPGDYPDGAPAAEDRHRDVVPDTMRRIDRAIGEVADALGPDDTILVVSDHGFRADTDGVRRTWETDGSAIVRAAGVDPAREGFSVVSGWRQVTVRVHPGPVGRRDATLDRLVDLFGSITTADGAPLFRTEILDMAERPPEARRSIRMRMRQWLVRLFLWWYDIELDENAHAYLFALPDAKVLDALPPTARVSVPGSDVRLRAGALFTANDFTGTHDPIGVFLAAGGPIRAVPGRGSLSVLDVAPLLLYLAGAPIPDDLEGRLAEEWIRADWLAAHPPVVVPAPDPGVPTELRDPVESDARLRDRLRALGYLE